MNRVLFKSASVEWPTPRKIYEELDREFHFTLDPCPFGGTQDGLATLFTSWEGQRVFINPPYGPKIKDWLKRAPEADLAVLLLPSRTDTRWFHDLVLPHASEIRFLRGRITFEGAAHSAPFPSMVVVFKSRPKL
jgi:hypothetical protein